MPQPEVDSFLALAREDLALARAVLGRFDRQAAFHLQQAAEKLAKAVLSAETIPFPRSHDIGALAALLPADHRWRNDLNPLDRLTVFATVWRYPDPGGRLLPAPPTSDLAASADELATLLDLIEPWARARAGG